VARQLPDRERLAAEEFEEGPASGISQHREHGRIGRIWSLPYLVSHN
jgi:hypothetical protein